MIPAASISSICAKVASNCSCVIPWVGPPLSSSFSQGNFTMSVILRVFLELHCAVTKATNRAASHSFRCFL